jgi:hypothetical protein
MFATRQELPTREDCVALCVKTVPSNHSVCHRKNEVRKQRSNEVTMSVRGKNESWKLEIGKTEHQRGVWVPLSRSWIGSQGWIVRGRRPCCALQASTESRLAQCPRRDVSKLRISPGHLAPTWRLPHRWNGAVLLRSWGGVYSGFGLVCAVGVRPIFEQHS